MWDNYIRGAIQWAKDCGTDGLDALTYFTTVWFIPAVEAEYAANLYMGMNEERAKEKRGNRKKENTPRPTLTLVLPQATRFRFAAFDRETMELRPDRDTTHEGTDAKDATSKLARQLQRVEGEGILGDSGLTVFSRDLCFACVVNG